MPHTIDTYSSPNDSRQIELDPNNDGRIVRIAFAVESIFNLFTLPLLTNTKTVLSHILNDPKYITPATTLFARMSSAIVIGGLTTALWTGIPNTKTALESRPIVYITLGGGELVLLPILILEALKRGGPDAALSLKACVVSIGCLAPILLWRAYALFVKPELMGRYRVVKKD